MSSLRSALATFAPADHLDEARSSFDVCITEVTRTGSPHSGPFDDAAMMQSNGRIDQIAAERAQPRKRPLLVGTGKLAVSDRIRRKNGCKFPSLRHGSYVSYLLGPLPKSGLNTSEKVADELPVPHPDTASGAPDQTKSPSENEVLGRAIDMIRSALEKRAE
jgi:hypothetical protein